MIGKTRQQPTPEMKEVFDPELGKSRGILRLPTPAGKYKVSRRSPLPELTQCIAHYWTVSWDLRGFPPHVQETVPHPNVYLVFENNKLLIGGVSTSKFTRVLEGESYAFGVKFKPGGFHPFLKSSVSTLTNSILAANVIFGNDGDALESRLVSCRNEDERVEVIDKFFHSHAPEPDTTIMLASQMVERILQEPNIKTVDDLVSQTDIKKRTLQRIFNEYVGVSPKWVIRRYRLHELIERLNSGERLDWCQMALQLGYFDQAHLINDFRSITGYSPGQYQTLLQKDS
ncbi:MAG TPA: helix-turn-helix domain-containing protein [Acidobacteriaceae bacterium]|nr:helix-turn-helix domain-containing protein [Acidobacteriaceae bacterium]